MVFADLSEGDILSLFEYSSDFSSSLDKSASNSKKPRKKYAKRPSNNPTYMPALRILRRDVRRKYAPMLMNVLNSHDPAFMRKFFLEFGLPTIAVKHHAPEDSFLNIYRPMNMIGTDVVVQSFIINYSLMPDLIIRLSQCRVCQTLNIPGSRLVLKANFSGTMLYAFCQNMEENRRQLRTELQSIFQDQDSPLLTPLDPPCENLMEATVVVYLDPLHFISEVNVHVLNSQFRELHIKNPDTC